MGEYTSPKFCPVCDEPTSLCQCPPASEGRTTEPAGPDNSLLARVSDEADLCRNEGANDIANLLDEVAAVLQAHSARGTVEEKIIQIARDWVRDHRYVVGMKDSPAKGPGNRMADALVELDAVAPLDRGNG